MGYPTSRREEQARRKSEAGTLCFLSMLNAVLHADNEAKDNLQVTFTRRSCLANPYSLSLAQ